MIKEEVIVDFNGCEVLEKRATGFGTGAHVVISKK